MKILSILILLLTLPLSSFADEPYYRSGIICHPTNDAAVIRFSLQYVGEELKPYPTLPANLATEWDQKDNTNTPSCTLKNGNIVSFKIDSDPASATGMGGGDPSEYITIWINKKEILTHYEHKPRAYTSDTPTLNSIFIYPDRLELCGYPKGIALYEVNEKALESIVCTKRSIN